MIATLTLALLLSGTDQAALHAAAASACAAFPLRKTGTIRYFCDCQAGAEVGCAGNEGNDASEGTSPAAPKRTWAAVISTFNAMNAGDTVALCKGGAWAVPALGGSLDCGYNLTNPRCAEGASLLDPANASTCDLRDYTPPWGGAARPLVAVSSATGGRIINRFDGSVNGVRILNLSFRGSNAGPNGGVYHNDTAIQSGLCNVAHDSGWLICNDTFDRFRLAMQMANSSSTWSRFIVRGNRFTMNDLDAMLLGCGDDDRVDANVFDNDGGWVSSYGFGPAHSVYLAGNGASCVSHRFSIVNNEFRRTAEGTSVGPCGTPVLEAHHQYDGIEVENNRFDMGTSPTSNCYGIDLAARGSPPTFFRDLTVRRNVINAGGNGITVGQAPGVVIENNVITLLDGGAWKIGIISPQDAARTAADGGPDDVETGATIRNNTIYATGTSANITGILVGTEGSGHVIAGNAVQLGGTCFSTPLVSSAYAFVGNNACYQGTWGTAYDATAHLVADPLFVSPPDDLSLQPLSPLRRAGNPAYAPPVDFQGNARPATPSIGAYDVGSGSGSSGGSSSGGPTGGGAGSRAGCGTSGEVPGALAGLMLLALLGAGRRARFRP